MNRIVLIGRRNDGLRERLLSLLPDAVVEPSFHFKLQSQDVLCWLPKPDDPVDQDVYDLVDLIDDSNVTPAKIVMLSIAAQPMMPLMNSCRNGMANRLWIWYWLINMRLR